MYFIEQGDQSQQTILFIHNGNGSSKLWQKQFEFFKDYHLIAVDLAGHGKNQENTGDYGLEAYTKDITSFILDKNIQNPIIIGNCIGSSIALNYSQLESANVKQLILFNICPGKYMAENIIFRKVLFKLFSVSLINKLLFKIFILFTPKYYEEITPLNYLFNKEESKETEFYKIMAKSYAQDTQKTTRYKLFLSLDKFTIDNFYKYFEENTLSLIWGAENKVVPLSARNTINEIIKPKKLINIENTGHLLLFEDHLKVNLLIKELIND